MAAGKMYVIDENNRTLVDLVLKAKDGSDEAKMAVIGRMEALLRKCAKENDSWKLGCGIDQNDLYQAGCQGVLKAIDKYEPKFKKTFSTYARDWIQAYMGYLVYHNSATIRVPLLKARKYNQIMKDMDHLSSEELSQKHKIAGEKISELIMDNPSTVSIHEDSDDEDRPRFGRGKRMEDSVSDPSGLNPYDYADENERMGVFRECLGLLTQKERDVVESFYGLAGGQKGGLTALGKKYGCTSQNLYTIKTKAVQKLTNAVREKLGIFPEELSESDSF